MSELKCDLCASTFESERAFGAHPRDGKVCKYRQLAARLEQDDLLQVTGQDSIALADLGIEITYGRVPKDKRNPFDNGGSKPFAARWAVLLLQLFHPGDSEPSRVLRKLIDDVRDDEETQAAIMTVAALAADQDEGHWHRPVIEYLQGAGLYTKKTKAFKVPDSGEEF